MPPKDFKGNKNMLLVNYTTVNIKIQGAGICVLLILLAAKLKRKLGADIDENERKKKASQEGMVEIIRCFYSNDKNEK